MHSLGVVGDHDVRCRYWPGRWSIVEAGRSLYPRDEFNAWYSGNSTGVASKHVQQCAWNPQTCNTLCPDFT